MISLPTKTSRRTRQAWSLTGAIRGSLAASGGNRSRITYGCFSPIQRSSLRGTSDTPWRICPHSKAQPVSALILALTFFALNSCASTPQTEVPSNSTGATQPANPAASPVSTRAQACTGPATNPPIQHVFLVVLENKNYENTFGDGSHSKLKELSAKGRLLTNYWGIGHNSLDNYIALVSGQAPNPVTQMDCPIYLDWVDMAKVENLKKTLRALGENKVAQLLDDKESRDRHNPQDAYDQLVGAGCVYPKSVPTIANQLEANHLTWRAYMQDMKGNCKHPHLNTTDTTAMPVIGKKATYTPRHNPFVYFHKLIGEGDSGVGSCYQNDRTLGDLNPEHEGLAKDLQLGDIPNFVFISPNLCNDGHTDCLHPKQTNPSRKRADESAAIDSFVPQLVELITNSGAYKDSMVIITFDEAEEPKGYSPRDEEPDEDTAATIDWADRCCDEQPGPIWKDPGIGGPGGGKVGAIVLSPFIKKKDPPDENHEYNHYALLRTIEDLFNLGHLGFAGQDGLNTFQRCGVFDASPGPSAS
jgi:hypothetical protein